MVFNHFKEEFIVRIIQAEAITEAVAKLCKETAYYLPEDVYEALK